MGYQLGQCLVLRRRVSTWELAVDLLPATGGVNHAPWRGRPAGGWRIERVDQLAVDANPPGCDDAWDERRWVQITLRAIRPGLEPAVHPVDFHGLHFGSPVGAATSLDAAAEATAAVAPADTLECDAADFQGLPLAGDDDLRSAVA
jgi:hypothetical protein